MPKKIEATEEKTVRELSVRKCDSFGNYEIYYQGGGEIPNELKGIFTNETMAKRRLEAYLEIQGIINEKKKIKESIKSITPLDHTYDEV